MARKIAATAEMPVANPSMLSSMFTALVNPTSHTKVSAMFSGPCTVQGRTSPAEITAAATIRARRAAARTRGVSNAARANPKRVIVVASTAKLWLMKDVPRDGAKLFDFLHELQDKKSRLHMAIRPE